MSGGVVPLPAAPPASPVALERAIWCRELDALAERSLSAAIMRLRAERPDPPSAATLRRWHLAWRRGGVAALADKRGGRARKAYGWEAEATRLWNRPSRPAAATVAYWLREEGDAAATESRVRRYLRSLPATAGGEHSAGRAGAHYRRQNVLPYVVRDRTALDVGLIYEGDGHTCDVYVQHPSTGGPWRPELTIWMDLRSRFVAGWWLSEAESALSTLHGLAAALTRHDHVPAALHVDPGSGFVNRMISDEATGWLGRIGVDLICALPGNAKGKGDVEGWFRWFEERCGKRFETYMQGRTDDLMRRLEKSVRDGAARAPSLAEYAAAVGAHVDAYNAAPQRDLGAAPAEIWARLERSPVELPEASLLRPSESRSVRRGGVELFGRLYRHPQLQLVEGRAVEARYDLTDDSRIWVYYKGRRVCEAGLVRRRPWAEESRVEDLRAGRRKGRERRLLRRLEDARAEERPPIDAAAAAEALAPPDSELPAPPDFDPFDVLEEEDA